jgi:hypothetical protein
MFVLPRDTAAGTTFFLLQSQLSARDESRAMRKPAFAFGALGAALLLFTGVAAAADGGSAQHTDLLAGLPAFLQSPEFMAGIIAGAVVTHLVHLMWHAGRQVLVHTLFFGQRTLHYGVVAALLGGLILLI